jgi:hypothetical protein
MSSKKNPTPMIVLGNFGLTVSPSFLIRLSATRCKTEVVKPNQNGWFITAKCSADANKLPKLGAPLDKCRAESFSKACLFGLGVYGDIYDFYILQEGMLVFEWNQLYHQDDKLNSDKMEILIDELIYGYEYQESDWNLIFSELSTRGYLGEF